MATPAPRATGEKQTIQARHGVATFVPKGHTIKIINTYGKQVVDTWAFALPAPPEDEEIDKGGEEEEVKKAEGSKEVEKEKKVQEGPSDVGKKGKQAARDVSKKTEETAQGAADEAVQDGQKVTEKTSEAVEGAQESTGETAGEAKKTTEKVSEKVDGGGKKGWSSYLPSVRRGTSKAPEAKGGKEGESKEEEASESMTKSWSSYLPSVGGGKKAADSDNTNSQSKGWSSYIPSGVGFSSYMPPKGTLSGFAATHARDPTKSYAEQLLDFSKTPVGAAGLSGKSNPLQPTSLRKL
jgi:hypothetical protein